MDPATLDLLSVLRRAGGPRESELVASLSPTGRTQLAAQLQELLDEGRGAGPETFARD